MTFSMILAILAICLGRLLLAQLVTPWVFSVSPTKPTGKARCREPAPFSGKLVDFAEWLFTMDEAIRVLRPTDPVGYAASLEGRARHWLVGQWEGERPSSWSEFRNQLVSAFSMKHDEERNRLLLVRARQKGTLEEYSSQFSSLCLLARDVDELTKVALFTEGLADHSLRKEVRKMSPSSLSEVIRVSQTLADTELLGQPFAAPPHNLAHSELAQVSREAGPPRQRRLDPEERWRLMAERRCFQRREVGHIAKDCKSIIRDYPNECRQ